MLATKIGITGTVYDTCLYLIFGLRCLQRALHAQLLKGMSVSKKSHSTGPQRKNIITQAMSWKSLRLRQFTSQLFIVFMITINKKKVIDASFVLFFPCLDLVTSKPTHPPPLAYEIYLGGCRSPLWFILFQRTAQEWIFDNLFRYKQL